MVCSETDLKRNHDEYLKFVQEKVSIARKALEDVMKASDFCRENIQVCDEVVFENGSTKFVVTSIKGNMLNGIGRDGCAFVDKYESKWRKTGRHFKTAELLMKELEEEK